MAHSGNPLPNGMKGVFRGGGTGQTHRFKDRLPAYWGIDLVMIPLLVWLTVLVITHWDAILVTAARIVSGILCLGTVLLVVALVAVVLLGIRNKRVW